MNVKLITAGFVTALTLGGLLGCLVFADDEPATTSRFSTTTPPILSHHHHDQPPLFASPASEAPTGASGAGTTSLTAGERPTRGAETLYAALERGEGIDRGLLDDAFGHPDDWGLQELAFAAERRLDPATHREHVLALAKEPRAPIGALVGALSSVEALDAATQDRFLADLARSQGRGLGSSSDLEAAQRRDLLEGAVAALVDRVTPYRRVEWLLESTGLERLILADRLDAKGLLTGPQGLSLPDARKLVDALVRDAEGHEDLATWGAELLLIARLHRDALDVPALRTTLRKALASKNLAVRETARELLGGGS